MKETLLKIFPEILELHDETIRENVLDTYVAALVRGHWRAEEMDEIPFTLDFPEFLFSYTDHVHGVTRVSLSVAKVFNEIYRSNTKYRVDADLVLAGALLHDVGKLVEYEKDGKGFFQKTAIGKDLRHPVLGAMLAFECGCGSALCHIIAVHAAEGDCVRRSPEAIIVNKADFLNFDIINDLRSS